jgi:glycosyltransferase involved in cell wall biosynthesis
MRLSKPRITIGLPVYNGEAFLGTALDSLLAQRYSDFQIVVSDNASTDCTEEISREYAKHDSRVRYDRLDENVGAIGNFNHVFRFCDSQYFKWAACDDVYESTYLERCIAEMDRNESVVWCHSQSGKIDEHGRVLQIEDPRAEGWSHTSHAGLPRANSQSKSRYRRFRGVLLGTVWCADSYGVIRSEALRKTKLFPACFGSERVLIGALSLQGPYAEIPETLFYQRIHSQAAGSICSAADQAAYAVGKKPKRCIPTRPLLLKGHLDVIRNTQMSFGDRMLCRFAIVQYLCQVRKWKRVITETITGRGVGQLRNRTKTLLNDSRVR